MAISGDYPHPVTVNGFSCKNCTDVDYAKKHVDPAHPKSGPYGVNADSDPDLKRDAAVRFGGQLAKIATDRAASDGAVATSQLVQPGQSLNITV